MAFGSNLTISFRCPLVVERSHADFKYLTVSAGQRSECDLMSLRIPWKDALRPDSVLCPGCWPQQTLGFANRIFFDVGATDVFVSLPLLLQELILADPLIRPLKGPAGSSSVGTRTGQRYSSFSG